MERECWKLMEVKVHDKVILMLCRCTSVTFSSVQYFELTIGLYMLFSYFDMEVQVLGDK